MALPVALAAACKTEAPQQSADGVSRDLLRAMQELVRNRKPQISVLQSLILLKSTARFSMLRSMREPARHASLVPPDVVLQ